jgi:DNA-binding transcriptional regulator YhcF (GntR family)
MNKRLGWLKISRGIVNHWLWHDAERLKWWLDLLLMAAWEEKQILHDTHIVTLRRGQMVASVSFLTERWKKSNKTILRFLNMLEDEGMIRREMLHRQTSIITICNYESYQCQEETIVQTIVQTSVQTSKEIKNNLITNEEVASENENETELFSEMRQNDIWQIEAVCMKFKISQEECLKRIDEFELDCKCRSQIHTDRRDIYSHFTNWLKIQQNKEKQQNHERVRQESKDKRRGVEVNATSAKDFTSSF